MPDEQLEEGQNVIHPPTLFLRLTSSRFLVSLDPLDLRSLLISSTFIGNLIMFPLFPDRSLEADHRRSSTASLGDMVLNHRPIRRICIDRIPAIEGRK